MALSNIIKNFFNSLCCGGDFTPPDPCEGIIPHDTISFDEGTKTFTLSGGNGVGATRWSISLFSVTQLWGILPEGETTFTFPGYDPEACYDVNWIPQCTYENVDNPTWHTTTVGNCPNAGCEDFLENPYTHGVAGYSGLSLKHYFSLRYANNSTGDADGIPYIWELIKDAAVIESGSHNGFSPSPRGLIQFDTVLDLDNECYTVRWKTECEENFREQLIGNCGPCAGILPHDTISFDEGTKTFTLSGGNGIGNTIWGISEFGVEILGGTLLPGQTNFSFPGYNPESCYRVYWVHQCDLGQAPFEENFGTCVDPCEGVVPHDAISFNPGTKTFTVSGGNGIGSTYWNIHVGEDLVLSGVLSPSEDSFEFPDYDPEVCYNVSCTNECFVGDPELNGTIIENFGNCEPTGPVYFYGVSNEYACPDGPDVAAPGTFIGSYNPGLTLGLWYYSSVSGKAYKIISSVGTGDPGGGPWIVVDDETGYADPDTPCSIS